MRCMDCRGAGSTFRWFGIQIFYSTLVAWLFLRFASSHERSDGTRVVFEPLWCGLPFFGSLTCRPCNGWGGAEPMPPIDVKNGPCPVCQHPTDWDALAERDAELLERAWERQPS